MTKLSLPSPVRFALPDGCCFRVAPHTRRQMRLALQLEGDDLVLLSRLEAGERNAQQLAALVGADVESEEAGGVRRSAAAPILAGLFPAQEARLLHALLRNGVDGMDTPAKAPAPRREPLAARMRRYDADTLALALHLAKSPSEIEATMGFVESLLLLEKIYDHLNRERRFEASLHGMELR